MLNQRQRKIIKTAFKKAMKNFRNHPIKTEDLMVWLFISGKLPEKRSLEENHFMIAFNKVYGKNNQDHKHNKETDATGAIDNYLMVKTTKDAEELVGRAFPEDEKKLKDNPASADEVYDYAYYCIIKESEKLIAREERARSLKFPFDTESVVMQLSNSGNNIGLSALLHYGIYGGSTNREKIADLVEKSSGIGGLDINLVDGRGMTLLMKAALLDDHNTIQYLVRKRETKRNRKNFSGKTALMLAIRSKKITSSLALIEGEDGAVCDEQDDDGNSTLIMAVKESMTDVIKKLLELKVDVNIGNNRGYKALNFSIIKNDVATAMLLMDHHAKFHVTGFVEDFRSIPIMIIAIISNYSHYSENFSIDGDQILNRCLARSIDNSRMCETARNFLKYFQQKATQISNEENENIKEEIQNFIDSIYEGEHFSQEVADDLSVRFMNSLFVQKGMKNICSELDLAFSKTRRELGSTETKGDRKVIRKVIIMSEIELAIADFLFKYLDDKTNYLLGGDGDLGDNIMKISHEIRVKLKSLLQNPEILRDVGLRKIKEAFNDESKDSGDIKEEPEIIRPELFEIMPRLRRSDREIPREPLPAPALKEDKKVSVNHPMEIDEEITTESRSAPETKRIIINQSSSLLSNPMEIDEEYTSKSRKHAIAFSPVGRNGRGKD